MRKAVLFLFIIFKLSLALANTEAQKLHDYIAIGNDSAAINLIEENCLDVDFINHKEPKRDWTPLINAIFYNRTEAIYTLINCNADLNLVSNGGQTALYFAASSKEQSAELIILSLLRAGAEVNIKSHSGISPLMRAADLGNAQFVRYFYSHGAELMEYDYWNRSALYMAASEGHKEVVKVLVSLGFPVDKRNTNESSTLHELLDVGVDFNWDGFEALLEAGADVNSRNYINGTPIMAAAAANRLEAIDRLVLDGAKVNDQSDYGWTALMFAARNCHLKTIELLLSYSADPTLKNQDGETAKRVGWACNGLDTVLP